jgi:hypothetical protein
MVKDLRFTLRALRNAPWYAVTIVLVIAVTLALATTVFAVVDGVMFRPLPYPDAGRLVAVEPGLHDLAPWTPGEDFRGVSEIDLANWSAAVP